ncbi:reprolysin-like metallopeptidase [Ferrimonas sp. SCSIO 43195]|uniref:reprolysin-like metallopeptidase n=1 Tax=Ferrimonas sp. SCSIO 43195 TaxID=2822844 RepID=UPI002075C393|nr:Calx-beta domain-containing protein [Ferrimonas sp. SCSIO 43195]USD36418.1 hypothetical protein J8Z22_15530 [Ferrimonas sp. SCSIO 43195]
MRQWLMALALMAVPAVMATPVPLIGDTLSDEAFRQRLNDHRQSVPMPTPSVAAANHRQVDLLVFAPSWAQPRLSYEQMLVIAQQGVAATNQAFITSGAQLQLRLRALLPASAVPMSTQAASLLNLFADDLQVQAALNRYYGADLAMLLVPAMDDAAGIAFLPGQASVVSYQGFADSIRNAVFAHELGHNFGAGHEGEANGLFPYSHAIDCGFGRTLMWSFVSNATLASFSSPGLSAPLGCGDAVTADNGRTLSESADFIADQAQPLTERGTLAFVAARLQADEGSAVSVPVRRTDVSQVAAAAVRVSGNGYQGPALLALTFEAGVEEAMVELVTSVDGINADRELLLELLWPSGSGVGAQSTTVVALADADANGGPGSIVFSQSLYQVSAGERVQVGLSRIGGSQGLLTVRLQTIALTAVAGQDYAPLDTTVTFAEGEVSKSVDVTTFSGDQDSALLLRLTSAGGQQSEVRLELTATSAPDSGGGGGGSLGWWGLWVGLTLVCRRRIQSLASNRV